MKKKMKKKTIQKHKWYAEFHEPDYMVNVFRNGDDILWHIKNNGPVTISIIEVDKKTDTYLKKHFKNPDIWAMGLSWNKYAPEQGFRSLSYSLEKND